MTTGTSRVALAHVNGDESNGACPRPGHDRAQGDGGGVAHRPSVPPAGYPESRAVPISRAQRRISVPVAEVADRVGGQDLRIDRRVRGQPPPECPVPQEPQADHDLGGIGRHRQVLRGEPRVQRPRGERPQAQGSKALGVLVDEPVRVALPVGRVQGAAEDGGIVDVHASDVVHREHVRLVAGRVELGPDGVGDLTRGAELGGVRDEDSGHGKGILRLEAVPCREVRPHGRRAGPSMAP